MSHQPFLRNTLGIEYRTEEGMYGVGAAMSDELVSRPRAKHGAATLWSGKATAWWGAYPKVA